jgi:hypothetical protein
MVLGLADNLGNLWVRLLFLSLSRHQNGAKPADGDNRRHEIFHIGSSDKATLCANAQKVAAVARFNRRLR